MLELPENVTLFDFRRNSECQAKLVRLTRSLAAQQIDGTWWEIEGSKKVREVEVDHHWVWRKLVGQHRNDLVWDSLAVQRPTGHVERAMLYRIDAKSQIETNKGTIYVDRLATAPRNRPWIVKNPRFKRVGSTLLLAAIRHSYTLGLGGRVWLTSLPSERTREFYKKRGFVPIYEDDGGMIDFEIPAARAVKWLKIEGYL